MKVEEKKRGERGGWQKMKEKETDSSQRARKEKRKNERMKERKKERGGY